MMPDKSYIAGALVDCTILVIAFLAWRIDASLQHIFIGVLCSMAGARVAMLRKPPGPPGPPGVVSTSAGMALCIGLWIAGAHLLSKGSPTT
jgi:hypothetical protein